MSGTPNRRKAREDGEMSLREDEGIAREELREWVKLNPGIEPHDAIHEIADSGVPVYTGELLEYAYENHDLAVDEPELGPAFDGSPTPTNIIAANIFERLEAVCFEEWQKIQDEQED